MKYCKPGAHSIFATKANAICVSGSIAAADSNCIDGTDVGTNNCKVGSAADSTCQDGAGAAPGGSITDCDIGNGVTLICYTGGNL